jgi:hypothetical protein
MSSSGPFISHEAPKAQTEIASPHSSAGGGSSTSEAIAMKPTASRITLAQIQWYQRQNTGERWPGIGSRAPSRRPKT